MTQQLLNAQVTAQMDASVDTVDAMPEFFHYEDTGCEAASSCLNCPLPRCKYDDPIWYQRNRRLAKDFQVVYTIQRERLSVEVAAERFSVTVRTIFRIMQRCRNATPDYTGNMAGQEAAALAA